MNEEAKRGKYRKRGGVWKRCEHAAREWSSDACSRCPWYGSVYRNGKLTRLNLNKWSERETLSKTEANTVRANMVEQLEAGTLTTKTTTAMKSNGLTLNDYAATWLATLAARVKPMTVKFYTDTVNRVILPVLGDRPLVDLEPADAEQLASTLVKKGHARSSIRGVLRTLSALLSHAAKSPKKTGVKSNVLLGAQLGDYAAQARAKADPNPFTESEATALLTAAGAHRDRPELWTAFFLTALHTGLRIGELLGADWDAIDLKARTLTVSQQCTRDGNLGTTKTGKTRVVDLTETLVAQLTAYRKHRLAEFLKLGEKLPAAVFSTDDGERLDGRNCTRALHALCRRAKVKVRGMHQTRHTFASTLLSHGQPVIYVSTQLGHSSPAETMATYARWIPRDDSSRRGVDVMPAFASGAR